MSDVALPVRRPRGRALRFRILHVAALATFAVAAACKDTTDPDGNSTTPTVVQEFTGNDQQATVGTQLPNPFVVEVLDARGRPVGGATVNFAVASGGGSVSPTSAVTNVEGQARTTLRLGTTAGEQRVTATVGSLTPVTFVARAMAATASQVVIVSGNGQPSTVGADLPSPIVVKVSDAHDNGVPGIVVQAQTFGNGTLTLTSSTTDAQGRVSGTWRLGTAAGAQQAQVSAALPNGNAWVTLNATAAAGPADAMVTLGGDAQQGDVSRPLPQPLVVRVSDAYGNPAANVDVAFAVTQGGGTLSAATARTGANGNAQVTWTLGAAAGQQRATATLARAAGPVVRQFTATALAASPATLFTLAHRVLDAEFSASANRIVTISADPARLNVIEPATQAVKSVTLPLTPLHVSVNPAGTHAAVSHDGHVSLVELATPSIVKTVTIPTTGGDIVLNGRNVAYVFPRSDQWVNVHSINLTTGVRGTSPYPGPYANARIRLHPSGDWIYSASNGLSPSDIEKYDARTDTAKRMYDSPYHGDYAMNGNLWISGDGSRIFVRAGNVFRASTAQSEDMRYAGALSGATTVNWVVHRDATSRVYVLGAPASSTPWDPATIVVTEVRSYEPQFLGFQGTARLPKFTAGSTDYQSEGHYAFASADGTKLYVLVRAPGSSGLQNDWGVATFNTADIP